MVKVFTYYCFEVLMREAHNRGHSQITCIYYREGFKMSQLNKLLYDWSKIVLGLLQQYYPETLFRVYVYPVDMVFEWAWKII